MTSAGLAPLFHFRLRTLAEGPHEIHLLREGTNTIGSQSSSDLVLTTAGVSRRHAELRVAPTDGEIELEDLGSKNGTFVNGKRIHQVVLAIGDEITFGSSGFRLEQVARGDQALAIVLEEGARAGAKGLPSSRTSLALSESTLEMASKATFWLDRAHAVLEPLCARPEADLGTALERLNTALDSDGACFVEWSKHHRPTVLSARGALPDIRFEALRDRLFDIDAVSGVAHLTHTDPPWSCVARGRYATEAFALVISGTNATTPSGLGLAALTLRWVERLRQDSKTQSSPLARPAERRLVFPPGILPCVSPAMRALYRQMRSLLDSDLPILVLGETGVGKEHLAQTLHASSARRDGPFCAINCAALPEQLLEAEMFGIGKAVATGVDPRVGRFQLADGGTLFLDELGDLSPAIQAKLLRALQEKEIHPLGSAPVRVDVRIVAATNVDLLERCEAGTFRRDLYYRIAGDVLRAPPLRQRRDDIPLLVEGFLRRFGEQAHPPIHGLTQRALERLVDYDWPGNVRELSHEVRRLAHLCPASRVIDSSLLPEHLASATTAGKPATRDYDFDLKRQVEELEARVIQRALDAAGNQKGAARLLGISRNTLRAKARRYGLDAP